MTEDNVSAAPTEQQAKKGRFLVGGLSVLSLFSWTDTPLRLPPDPPLLSGNAIKPVLRDVGLLLDYLNKLPDMRLNHCFQPTTQQPGIAYIRTYNPPCATESYFLTRITAIAALEDRALATDITEPHIESIDNSKQIDSGAGEAAHLGNLAFLIWSRDLLSALASPATLETIRVTRAFRAGRMLNSRHTETSKSILDTADERDLFMSQYGLRIAVRVGRFQVLAIFLLWFSVYISVMVYSGQVLLVENAKLYADITSFNSRLSDAVSEEVKFVRGSLTGSPGNNDISLFAVQYCDISRSIIAPIQYIAIDAEVTSSNKASLSSSTDLAHEINPSLSGSRIFISNKQRMLCDESQELNRRKTDLRRSEGSWSEAASPVIAISTPIPGIVYFVRTLWKEVFDWNDVPQPRALETQRYAMQQLLNGLLAGIMPAMYAALGALVSLFRRLAILAEKELLGPGEYGGMMNSLVLGGLTGAVIGLFSNVVPQGEQSAGLPLATTALALLAGYAADQVFAMFDSLAMRVFVSQAESGGKKSG